MTGYADLLNEFRLGFEVCRRVTEDVTVNPDFFEEYQMTYEEDGGSTFDRILRRAE